MAMWYMSLYVVGIQKMHFIRFRDAENVHVSGSEIGVFWHNPSRELYRSTSRVMGCMRYALVVISSHVFHEL